MFSSIISTKRHHTCNPQKMKTFITLFSIFISIQLSIGQSPFNYGQNKKVYFMSKDFLESLNVQSIYIIDRLDEEGGMGQNWDINLISFDTNSVSDDWYPTSLDSSFKYNFDSIIGKTQFLNGIRYHFSNGKLDSYGGNGYGSFDWIDMLRFSDTLAILETSCVGHCGQQAIQYSKNTYNKKGQLTRVIRYPTPPEIDEMDELEMTLEGYQKHINSNVSAENIPDTSYFYYDQNGLFISNGKELKANNTTEIKMLFTDSNDLASSKFYQIYIENVEMEKYISNALGYAPELILMEIDIQGVFSFTFNVSDQKYYRTNNLFLE